MELFIILALGIAVFILFNRVGRLEERLNEIESGAKTAMQKDDIRAAFSEPQDSKQPTASTSQTARAQTSSYSPAGVNLYDAKSTTPASREPVPNPFFAWLQQDFLMKLGSFLLLLALVWFVSYAFQNNWVGPAGRITLGVLAGSVVMALGTWRIRTFLHQGGVFVALGAAGVNLTIFAARELYNFFTPGSSLILMFAVVVFVTLVSVIYRSKPLAIGGLILAGLAPLLTNAPDVSVLGLNLYLLIVVLGTLWVVFVTRWSELTFIALLMTYFYNLSFLEVANYRLPEAEADIALMFSLVFVALYFIANVASMRLFSDGEHTKTHIATVVGTGIYLFTWVLGSVDPQWQSLTFVAWALVFMFGTYFVYLISAQKAIFYIYSAISLALIGTATAVELSGPALTIAFMIEIGALMAVVAALRMPSAILSRVALLLFIPGFLTLPSLVSRSWNNGIMHGDFVVILLFTLVLFTTGVFLREYDTTEDSYIHRITQLILSFGAAYAVAFIWLTTHAIFPYDFGTLVSLVVYTVTAIICFILAQQQHNPALRTVGGVLIALVLGRLLIVEVLGRDMPTEVRVLVFFVIGIILVSTAFMGKWLKQHDTN